MRKLLFLLLTLTTLTTFGQTPKLKLQTDSTKVDVGGGVIDKGDEFIVNVQLNGNGNTTSRSLYFDFEFQNTAFELIDVTHTGTGGNGGVLPAGSSITLDWYQHPGYSWNSTQQNNTTNGNTNYQNASYTFTQGGPKTIIRAYLNWASANGFPYNNYDTLLRLRFRLKATATGNSWDPIKMNFAASFNQDGSTGSTLMETPLTTVITENPDANKYVKAQVNINGLDYTKLRVAFIKPDNTGPLFDVTSTGTVNIVDNQLAGNTQYKIRVMYNMDNIQALSTAAVTVSDYTSAQTEFVRQNLDGTYNNQNIITGMGYKAADVNRSDKLDGGDLTKLFAQAVGLENLVTLPQGYVVGSNGYMSLMTFKASDFNAATPANWATSFPASQQQVYTYTTPANPGTPETIQIRYLIPGDINRSHSSQVIVNGAVAVNTFINSPNTSIRDISVNLSNVTVTSNTIEIPVKISTNGENATAFQFEFKYDPTKIKFEELKNELPNTWYTFANKAEGVVRFGSIDRDQKSPVSGELVPFKLKFTALQNGLDINSFIKVTDLMDASNAKGFQLGINLNTTTIKLTGYNNF